MTRNTLYLPGSPDKVTRAANLITTNSRSNSNSIKSEQSLKMVDPESGQIINVRDMEKSPRSTVGLSPKKKANLSCLESSKERKIEEGKSLSPTKDEGKTTSVKSGVTSKRLSLKYSTSLIDEKP